jgi:Tfp pilus assembly protein PilO
LYFVVFSLFFTLIFEDTLKHIKHIHERKETEKKLTAEIESNKKILINAMQSNLPSLIQVEDRLINASDVLNYLSYFWVSHGMVVNKVQLLKRKTILGMNVLPVKINITGQFLEFSKLLTYLAEDLRPIVLNDFSLSIDRNKTMVAEMHLWVFSFRNKINGMNSQAGEPKNIDSWITRVPLQKMKWVGFLQQQQTIWGFVMSPEGKTIEVQVGSIIGLEKGRVMKVSDHDMRIDLGGRNVFIFARPAQKIPHDVH